MLGDRCTHTHSLKLAADYNKGKHRQKKVQTSPSNPTTDPTASQQRWQQQVKWEALTPELLRTCIRPWISRTVTTLIGDPEPRLLDYICGKLHTRTSKDDLLEDPGIEIMGDDAPAFVNKMWRFITAETNATTAALAPATSTSTVTPAATATATATPRVVESATKAAPMPILTPPRARKTTPKTPLLATRPRSTQPVGARVPDAQTATAVNSTNIPKQARRTTITVQPTAVLKRAMSTASTAKVLDVAQYTKPAQPSRGLASKKISKVVGREAITEKERGAPRANRDPRLGGQKVAQRVNLDPRLGGHGMRKLPITQYEYQVISTSAYAAAASRAKVSPRRSSHRASNNRSNPLSPMKLNAPTTLPRATIPSSVKVRAHEDPPTAKVSERQCCPIRVRGSVAPFEYCLSAVSCTTVDRTYTHSCSAVPWHIC